MPNSTNYMPRLAAAIITHDDAAKIDATIRSVPSMVERVYVLDLGSADDTVEIAENAGAAVIKSHSKEDYSASRNELLERIEDDGKTDHVLWIDAGELFDPRTEIPFRNFIQNDITPDEAHLLVVRRAIPCDDETLEKAVSRSDFTNRIDRSEREEETIEPRLMPLFKGLRFTGRLRESIVESLIENKIGLSAAPGRVVLLSPLVDVTARERRAKRSLHIINAAEIQDEPFTEGMLLERAESILWLGNPKAARELYRKLIETCTGGNVILEAYYRIDDTFRAERNTTNEPVESLIEAISKFPTDIQLLSLLGSLLHRRNQLEIAVRTLETAVKYGQTTFDVWHRWRIRDTTIRHLGMIYRMNGEPGKAIRLYEENLEEVREDSDLTRALIDLYALQGDEAKGLRIADSIWEGEMLDTMKKVISGAARASVGNWDAAVAPLAEAHSCGCSDPLCLRWYSLVLLSMLRFDDARPILEQWRDSDPGNIEPRAFLFASGYPERFAQVLDTISRTPVRSIEDESQAMNQTKPGALPDSLEKFWESRIADMKPAEKQLEPIDFSIFEFENPERPGGSEMQFRNA